jgi:hypothetical protein
MCSGADLRNRRGFPIRTSADQRSLASPRGFSQRATSFIAFWRQGIHRTPFSLSKQPPQPARRTKTHRCPALRPNPRPLPPRMSNRTSGALTETLAQLSAHPPPRLATGTAGGPLHTLNPLHLSKITRNTRQALRLLAENGGSRGSPDRGSLDNRCAHRSRCRAPSLADAGVPLPEHRPATMEAIGFEPTTPCLQSRCSPS